MGQQISTDDALPIYRQTCGELFDSNLLLRAQIGALERQLAELQEENTRLQQATPPPSGGPDLAAQPPYPTTVEESQESAYDGPR